MKKYKLLTMVSAAVIIAQIGFIALSSNASADEAKMKKEEKMKFSPYVDKNGNIILPKDFRMNMVHLGSWFVPEGDASGFHDVYTEAKSAQIFRETGKFPDGATLVKELRSSKSGNYTTGANVKYAKSDMIKQWFVMIKDTKGRFNGNAHWEEGWGWALFKTDNTEKNVSGGFKKSCMGCHTPAKNKDWVFTEGYPTLQQLAKKKK